MTIATSILVSSLSLLFAVLQTSASTTTIKPDKSLFVPSPSYPTLLHSQPPSYSSGSLESATFYYPDGRYQLSHMLQPPYPTFQRVLQNFLHHRGENRKLTSNLDIVTATDEDDYQRNANNLLSIDQLTPELEDLDRKYKRSTNYVPTLSKEDRVPVSNSRAVNVRPFGPYTTWSPYQGPLVNSHSAVKNSNVPRRRRQDNDVYDTENNYENSSPLLQYAPAFAYPQVEPYHIRFVRDMPIQYSLVYEPAYPVGRKTSETLPHLTNSIMANAAASAHADEAEKYSTY